MKAATLAALRDARAAKQPLALVTALESGAEALLHDDGRAEGDLALDPTLTAAGLDALKHNQSRLIEHEAERYFIHVYNPPLRLIIVGAVHIAQPLSHMAALAGYDVTLVDPRRAWASEERFPGLTLLDDWPDEALEKLKPDSRSAVVTLTHDPKLDDPALGVALRSPAFYIGALGSRRTHGKRLERLKEMGFGASDFARIHGPVGLDLGGRSPGEIAVSILAQMTLTLHGGGKEKKEAAE
jgi:xanthine dehydrogenase accessory factor